MENKINFLANFGRLLTSKAPIKAKSSNDVGGSAIEVRQGFSSANIVLTQSQISVIG